MQKQASELKLFHVGVNLEYEEVDFVLKGVDSENLSNSFAEMIDWFFEEKIGNE